MMTFDTTQTMQLIYRGYSVTYEPAKSSVIVVKLSTGVCESTIGVISPDDILKAASVAKDIIDDLMLEETNHILRKNKTINWSNSDRR